MIDEMFDDTKEIEDAKQVSRIMRQELQRTNDVELALERTEQRYSEWERTQHGN